MGTYSMVIPAGAGAVTFVGQAQKITANTCNLSDATIEVTPIRYQ
jgi:hypothetical protein